MSRLILWENIKNLTSVAHVGEKKVEEAQRPWAEDIMKLKAEVDQAFDEVNRQEKAQDDEEAKSEARMKYKTLKSKLDKLKIKEDRMNDPLSDDAFDDNVIEELARLRKFNSGDIVRAARKLGADNFSAKSAQEIIDNLLKTKDVIADKNPGYYIWTDTLQNESVELVPQNPGSEVKEEKDIYTQAVELVPELAKFDKNEVTKGLADEKEHKDVIAKFAPSNEVEFLAMVVKAHLSEKPNYYAILDSANELATTNKELADKIAHEEAESAEYEKQEHLKETKSRVREAILVEEKKEAIEQLTEAFNALEATYIKDICDLTEHLEAKRVDVSTIKVLENKVTDLDQSLFGTKKDLEETQRQLNIANKTVCEQIEAIKLAGLELNEKESLIDEATKQIIDIKEAHELEVKETRIRAIAETMAVKITDEAVQSLKECKTNEEIMLKMQESRNALAKSMIHQGIKESVTVGYVAPVTKRSKIVEDIIKIHSK